MLLRMLMWCVAFALIGAVAWPRSADLDFFDDSLEGSGAGFIAGALLGGVCEYASMRRNRGPK